MTNKNFVTKHIAAALAICTVLLSFVLFVLLLFVNIDLQRKDIIIYILGVLSAIDSQIFSYYFGSSHKTIPNKNLTIPGQLNTTKLEETTGEISNQ